MSTSNNPDQIPRYARAGVAFLGVEFGDALILVGSIFAALLLGKTLGTGAYIGIPVAGFYINRAYIEWRSKSLPGQWASLLFRWGLVGYSKAFSARETVFVGDAIIINPGSRECVDRVTRAYIEGRQEWK